MPRERTVTVYTFKELSDDAKDIARQWYREASGDEEWWDTTYEDAARVLVTIKEFDLDKGTIRGTLKSTFRDTLRLIMKEHGEACETFKVAMEFVLKLNDLKKKYEDADEDYDQTDEYEGLRAEFTSSILVEYLSLLRKEYEYRTSNEYVDECIEMNGYEFFETGKRA